MLKLLDLKIKTGGKIDTSFGLKSTQEIYDELNKILSGKVKMITADLDKLTEWCKRNGLDNDMKRCAMIATKTNNELIKKLGNDYLNSQN